jgi:hypothetical protein
VSEANATDELTAEESQALVDALRNGTARLKVTPKRIGGEAAVEDMAKAMFGAYQEWWRANNQDADGFLKSWHNQEWEQLFPPSERDRYRACARAAFKHQASLRRKAQKEEGAELRRLHERVADLEYYERCFKETNGWLEEGGIHPSLISANDRTKLYRLIRDARFLRAMLKATWWGRLVLLFRGVSA